MKNTVLRAIVLSIVSFFALPTLAHAEDKAKTPGQALQQDLGISPERAEQINTQQYQATQQDQQAQQALGDTYAGSVLQSDGTLVVKVKGDTVSPHQTLSHSEKARFESVPLSKQDLKAIQRTIHQQASSSVTGSYLDTASNQVRVSTHDVGETQKIIEKNQLPQEHIVLENNGEYPQPLRNYYGGERYFIDNGFNCSTAFPVVDYAGTPGFLTAGHCATRGTNAYNPFSEHLGTFQASYFPNSDMAWVHTPHHEGIPGVTMHDQNYLPVTGSVEMPINSYVCRSGGTTGWHCGYIIAKDQIVNYPQGQVNDLVRTNACAEDGDSGGAWITGDQAQGITSGGSGNCYTGGVTYYQPLEKPLREFGLSLKTHESVRNSEQAQPGILVP